ncbi:pre-mRNA-processing factor 19 [Fusarium pseudoanthophilum]|uniref:Pre-mRNA-processing factor 19 n=1 Tax=Fusarium pseudoanthophilum TaxID=48495 RepID=A0A8H5PPT4_9HYPO|nr:pre-mRNA-processing factor 19 [Fusarium pseudoanthophilum]
MKLGDETSHLNQQHHRAGFMANSVEVVVDEKRLIDQYINEHGTEPGSLAALEMATWELKGAHAMSALNDSIYPEGGKAFADMLIELANSQMIGSLLAPPKVFQKEAVSTLEAYAGLWL